MATSQATIQQMQGTLATLQQALTDVTQEAVSLRALATQNRAAIEQNRNAVQTLQQVSQNTWSDHAAKMDAQGVKIDDLEQEVNDTQAQVRRGGIGGGGGPHEPKEWNLHHKGDVDKYSGDSKNYKSWARKVIAFANSKKPGFRKALRWAEQKNAPLTPQDMAYAKSEWEHTEAANTKLYDLLIQVCTGDALSKVETTAGDEQGFEAWRRLARQYEPTSRLTKIEKLNMLTNTKGHSNVRDMIGKVEVWEQAWAKYELDHNQTLDTDLKLGALLSMLPTKEKAEIKLKYIENEAGLTYDVLRRQVEYWLESAQASHGPAPMDLSALSPEQVAAMNESQLEEALLVLRKGGKGKNGRDRGRAIQGNCWKCNKPGHRASDCQEDVPAAPKGPKGRKGGKKGKGKGRGRDANSLNGEEDDEDYEEDEEEEGEPLGMMGIGCLSYPDTPEDDDDDGIPDPDFDPSLHYYYYYGSDYDLDIMPFSEVDSESEGEDEEEEVPAIVAIIERELEQKRAIAEADSKIVSADSAKEEKPEKSEWQQQRRSSRVVAKIRDIPIPLTDAYKNPFQLLTDACYEPSDENIETKIENTEDMEVIDTMPAVNLDSGIAMNSDTVPAVNLQETLRKLETATAASGASPGTSLAGISPPYKSEMSRIEAITYRLDQSIDSPPGLEKPTVTVRISGASDEELIIVGKVVPDELARTEPAAIDIFSSPNRARVHQLRLRGRRLLLRRQRRHLRSRGHPLQPRQVGLRRHGFPPVDWLGHDSKIKCTQKKDETTIPGSGEVQLRGGELHRERRDRRPEHAK